MQVRISGKKIDVGTALQEYVDERLGKIVTKYFEDAIAGDVVFSKERHLYRADIHVNEGVRGGIVIKAEASAGDVYAAFDGASDRIEKQLRRYKDRIKKHKGTRSASDTLVDGTKYVIAVNDDSPEVDENGAIIAEKTTDIDTLSVSEAVMKMDLASLPTLLFINSANGRINVVYKRVDGNISWVDPKISHSQ